MYRHKPNEEGNREDGSDMKEIKRMLVHDGEHLSGIELQLWNGDGGTKSFSNPFWDTRSNRRRFEFSDEGMHPDDLIDWMEAWGLTKRVSNEANNLIDNFVYDEEACEYEEPEGELIDLPELEKVECEGIARVIPELDHKIEQRKQENIDGGSSDNIVSPEMVAKARLPITEGSQSFEWSWVEKSSEVVVDRSAKHDGYTTVEGMGGWGKRPERARFRAGSFCCLETEAGCSELALSSDVVRFCPNPLEKWKLRDYRDELTYNLKKATCGFLVALYDQRSLSFEETALHGGQGHDLIFGLEYKASLGNLIVASVVDQFKLGLPICNMWPISGFRVFMHTHGSSGDLKTEVFSGSTYRQGEIKDVISNNGVHALSRKAAHLVGNTNQVEHFQEISPKEKEHVVLLAARSSRIENWNTIDDAISDMRKWLSFGISEHCTDTDMASMRQQKHEVIRDELLADCNSISNTELKIEMSSQVGIYSCDQIECNELKSCHPSIRMCEPTTCRGRERVCPGCPTLLSLRIVGDATEEYCPKHLIVSGKGYLRMYVNFKPRSSNKNSTGREAVNYDNQVQRIIDFQPVAEVVPEECVLVNAGTVTSQTRDGSSFGLGRGSVGMGVVDDVGDVGDVGDVALLVLACDGIWDYMEAERHSLEPATIFISTRSRLQASSVSDSHLFKGVDGTGFIEDQLDSGSSHLSPRVNEVGVVHVVHTDLTSTKEEGRRDKGCACARLQSSGVWSAPARGWMEIHFELLDMLKSLGDLLKLLDISFVNNTLLTTYGKLQPPLGRHPLKVSGLISVLLSVGSEAAEKELVDGDEHMYSSFVETTHWIRETDVLEMIVDKFSFLGSPEVLANAVETQTTEGGKDIAAEKLAEAARALPGCLNYPMRTECLHYHLLDSCTSKLASPPSVSWNKGCVICYRSGNRRPARARLKGGFHATSAHRRTCFGDLATILCVQIKEPVQDQFCQRLCFQGQVSYSDGDNDVEAMTILFHGNNDVVSADIQPDSRASPFAPQEYDAVQVDTFLPGAGNIDNDGSAELGSKSKAESKAKKVSKDKSNNNSNVGSVKDFD